MSDEIAIEAIGQIAIAVTDVSRSVTFYQHTLGLALLFEAPPGLAFFDCGGVRLMITSQQGDAEDHNTSVIYYKVADIHAAASSLHAKGVVFEREPQLAATMPDHELWIGFLRDPDDNLLGIMAELPLPHQ
jgi:methylmalonyl-CoA/ethylmalonyl-CoA epimerase